MKKVAKDVEEIQPVPPKWIYPVIYGQLSLAIVLICAGVGHIMAKGYLANIGTGIYAGIGEMITFGFQLWILKKSDAQAWIGVCKFFIALSLILCTVNVPLISILSIVMGDSMGYPHRSCRYMGQIADWSCITVTDAPNVGALLCDAILMLSGLGSACLLAKSGLYFLPMTSDQYYRRPIHYSTTV